MQLPFRNPGSTCIGSSDKLTIRMPFLRIANGRMTATISALVHHVLRNMCAASRLVNNSAMLERMPLHSSATTIDEARQREHKPVSMK